MSRAKGIKETSKRETTHSDEGCELYPTCLGNEEYPQCPFRICFEDLTDSEGEYYDRDAVIALRRWFRGLNDESIGKIDIAYSIGDK